MPLGPCAKQVVRATLITQAGEIFHGENQCLTPQTICPRGDLPSGVGYELCESVCHQTGHAEVNAIRAAKAVSAETAGAVVFLEGHIRVCSGCRIALAEAGIDPELRVKLGPAPKRMVG